MKGLFNLENLVLNVATIGPLGKSPLGRFFAPLAALPLVFLGRQVYSVSKDLFYIPMIIMVVGIIWVVSFAFENMPIERTDQIIIPMIPGMAEAMLHLPLIPKIIATSFLLFSAINLLLERMVDKFSEDPTEKVRTDSDRINEFTDQEEIDHSETYALPPNKQKSLYEILMLPIGAGVITSFIVHMALILAKRL
jgi:hypothetical protein